jgi:hypothetical protein
MECTIADLILFGLVVLSFLPAVRLYCGGRSAFAGNGGGYGGLVCGDGFIVR